MMEMPLDGDKYDSLLIFTVTEDGELFDLTKLNIIIISIVYSNERLKKQCKNFIFIAVMRILCLACTTVHYCEK